jgi:hypothetical protein
MTENRKGGMYRLPMIAVLSAACVGPWSVQHAVAAAPLDIAPDSRTLLAIKLVDELKSIAGRLPDDSRQFLLLEAARYDYQLGRREACVQFLETREAELRKLTDPRDRLSKLTHFSQWWAVVDPPRARRLLEEQERALASLPAESRKEFAWEFAFPYFELGDFAKGMRLVENADTGDDTSTLVMYGVLGNTLLRQKHLDHLAVLRAKIRQVEGKSDSIDPKWMVDFLVEGQRMVAFAESGLPDDAAKLYEWCRATGEYPGFTYELEQIILSYAAAGRRDAGLAFFRKYLSQAEPEERSAYLTAAAVAGDYAFVRRQSADASMAEEILGLRSAVVIAHRFGDVNDRDELLALYREALGRLPAGEEIKQEFQIPCDLPTVEAVLGRYDAAVAMLPRLQDQRACEVRSLLVGLILRDQGKRFGRSDYCPTILYMSVPDLPRSVRR